MQRLSGLLGLLTKQCELRTQCSTLRTARGTRVTSRPISSRVLMLVRILPVRQFAVCKLPNPRFTSVTSTHSELGFANPDIRYPDIWIYPLILWQLKIRIF